MPLRLPLLLVLAAAPAAAAPMSAADFEAMAQGHVLRFSHDGAPFGAEQYFPGRRSLWRYQDGSCVTGVWWPEGELICFRYDGEDGSQCWRFTPGPALAAERVEDGLPTGFVLTMSGQDDAPLACPGPRVGS